MKITIVCVGRIKEKYWALAMEEYAKRLSRYCKLEIVELRDEKTPDGCADAVSRQILAREGERILGALKGGEYAVALAIDGKRLDSPGFARLIDGLGTGGRSHIAFVIGGSLGLDGAVLERSDCVLSFSDMTFPHQMMRVILLEQIYRAYRINNNEPYHK
ncbi:MAG: 23S rRNA (pseudouridine(1915)-N(3))-methyltransferase RlmH [Butyrivibrio sp.]|nr:23S rRNA (pseudouridine(1915)-N(3))-methyltransferase RlmH [Butyrivibrio sp.]